MSIILAATKKITLANQELKKLWFEEFIQHIATTGSTNLSSTGLEMYVHDRREEDYKTLITWTVKLGMTASNGSRVRESYVFNSSDHPADIRAIIQEFIDAADPVRVPDVKAITTIKDRTKEAFGIIPTGYVLKPAA